MAKVERKNGARGPRERRERCVCDGFVEEPKADWRGSGRFCACEMKWHEALLSRRLGGEERIAPVTRTLILGFNDISSKRVIFLNVCAGLLGFLGCRKEISRDEKVRKHGSRRVKGGFLGRCGSR